MPKQLGCVLAADWALVCFAVALQVRQCCSAGMQDAVDLLHPLLTDTVDYVKQGALIATALVLMQQPESKVGCLCPLPACSITLHAHHVPIRPPVCNARRRTFTTCFCMAFVQSRMIHVTD